MKKQIIQKIILSGAVTCFTMFFLASTLPIQALAANTGINWENPNANGDNPYKISTDAILNSQTLMQVVGCTGLVDGVSSAITGFAKSSLLNYLKTQERLAKEKAKARACEAVKAGLESGSSTLTGMSLTQFFADTIKCHTEIKTSSTEQVAAEEEAARKAEATKKREECFNGLAYTLAKNQLTSMTRETLNWVNTGFSGNPYYVQNMRSLTNSIERNVIESGIQTLANGAFPYGGDFSNTIIKSYNGGSMNAAANYLESLTSDLSAFLTDKDSYGLGQTDESLDAKARAIEDNNRFANDFAVGGWDGYMALTQREQNNPLGFTMKATQYLADRIAQQSNETKDEVSQNNGFLSQKECILWQLYGDDGNPINTGGIAASTVSNGVISFAENKYQTSTYKKNKNDKCIDWKVTTPGSIIKEKLTAYINSPERQLELADDINKSLSSLFTKLIENFRSEGLFGLSQEKYSAIDDMIGYGWNGTGTDGDIGSGYSSAIYSTGYSDDSFNLTRDLGNTYIHEPVRSLGTWNARTNMTNTGISLNVDLGVWNETSKGYEAPYYYYTVSEPGNTKLYNNGYTGWNYKDRVFWNGTEWQNWKCLDLKINKDKNGNITSTECSKWGSPINTRGIIQVQKDYTIAAREILKMLPSIMPKVGALDYCIPGPNPNFETNTTNTKEAFLDFTGSLSTSFDAGGFFRRNSTTITIAGKGADKYDNYSNIFKNIPTLFTQIQSTQPWAELHSLVEKYKDNKSETEVKDAITKTIQTVSKNITNFYTKYNQQIFEVYYGTMRSEYNEVESSPDLIPNTSYIPMIEDGYAITKNMVSRNEEIEESIEDYKSSIILANLNSAKLTDIKNQVSLIIKAAQARRDNDPEYQKKMMDYFGVSDWETALARYEQFKKDNPECLDEEDISYFDEGDLVVDTAIEAERCNDETDNDLDGKIDMNDPDCKQEICTNGVDDNEDGLIDMADPDCNTVQLSVSVTARPVSLRLGGRATISWSSTGASQCSTNNGNTWNAGTSGSYTDIPQLTGTRTYSVTCKGTVSGQKTASASVQVLPKIEKNTDTTDTTIDRWSIE